MDRSLDEIISERPQKQGGGRRERRSRNTSNAPRDGVKKSYRERVDLDRDWVHDRFEDEGDYRSNRRNDRSRRDRVSPDPDQPARLRVDNLHYDLTEDDLEGLFSQIGPVSRVRIEYDRAGRSEGIAIITYHHLEDAKQAIREFDGANAKGQPIRLTLLASRGAGSRGEKSKSLFDRIERPGARTERSLSPDSDGAAGGGRRRRRGGRGQHRSDVSKPPPDHIDRYVPGQRSPVRRNAGGRRPGERRDEKRREGGGGGRSNGSGPRPKKTQEELDQEMDDYWGSTNTAAAENQEAAAAAVAPAATEPAAVAAAPAAADDDIDMIE